MSAPYLSALSSSRVGAVRTDAGGYTDSQTSEAMARLGRLMRWADHAAGPLGRVIPAGARVVVKPNWVMHRNGADAGIEPLLTHAAVIRTVVEAAIEAGSSRVIVGDAPLQSCDFEELLRVTGIGRWSSDLEEKDSRYGGICDFRRTRSVVRDGIRFPVEDLSPLENFVLFDLAMDSLLEPITAATGAFRVTKYDPRHMTRTHRPGRHQYLIAREILEADVVINLPKLKTHRKAGITCALKNLIGINGNKEYLPHHRFGGSAEGGDCYPGRSAVKRLLEHAHDIDNRTTSRLQSRWWAEVERVLYYWLRKQGDDLGVDGAWSGNDTIWRTCLDLNRIILYGDARGRMAAEPQRRVLHIVDAIVAGDGDGPLAPERLPLGLMLAGENAAAVDLVGTLLLGYDPDRIPITREAFGDFDWPLTNFDDDSVELAGDLGNGRARSLSLPQQSVRYPHGWVDAAASGRIDTTVSTLTQQDG